MSGVVKTTPMVLDVVKSALGRAPTRQELIDLAPVAVMVTAFCASGRDGDQFVMECEQWSNSFLFGLYDSQGQKMELRIERGKQS